MSALNTGVQVVVFGTGVNASVGHYYLDQEPGFNVVAFTADGAYVKESMLEGLPVVPFEELAPRFGPEQHKMSIRLGATAINGLRATKFAQASAAGYGFANYRHPSAQIAGNVTLGPNAFILEHVVVHPFAKVGCDVTLGSGSIVGHHAEVGDHVFLASNASIMGFAKLGERSFVGANATVCEGNVVGRANFVGAGTVICQDTEPENVYAARAPRRLERSSIALSPWLVRAPTSH